MNFRDELTLRFVSKLVANPRGRAHVLNQVADAESRGEGQVFEQVLARVDDPQLAKMIEKHQADEVRHAALFRECLARTGVDVGEVPPELRLMDRLDHYLGGLLQQPVADREGVMRAYVLLQVVEERAVTQFAVMAKAFLPVDPAAALVVESVAADEERHLKYCHAIGRRYAPDEATRLRVLREYREIEARAYRDNSVANMRYTLEHKMVDGAVARLGWSLVGALSSAAGGLPYTRFAREPGGGAGGAGESLAQAA